MNEMKINAIAPWFGAKRVLAPTIVEELGPHRAYIEPFCGSLAVLLAKPIAAQETVNDLHGDLVNLAMVLTSDSSSVLYERLSRTLMCEAIHLQARQQVRSEPSGPPTGPPADQARHIDRAYDFFVMSWMGRNGISGTTAAETNQNIACRWTPGGGSGGGRFASAVDSIPAWHNRLRSIMILNRDGFEIIEKIDDTDGMAVYVDPPYLKESRSSGTYTHDFTDDDHRRLAKLLRRFKRTRVVVSYYDSPRLDDLYPLWTMRRFNINKAISIPNNRGGKPTTAPEVLLMNGPSLAKNDMEPLFQGETDQ